MAIKTAEEDDVEEEAKIDKEDQESKNLVSVAKHKSARNAKTEVVWLDPPIKEEKNKENIRKFYTRARINNFEVIHNSVYLMKIRC